MLVVGDEATLKVHVHTDEPRGRDGAVRRRRRRSQQLDVADMREQIAERSGAAAGGPAAAWSRWSSGDGDARALRGARRLRRRRRRDASTPRPTTCSPAIHEVPAEEVLVLPNTPNVVMAAERAAELSDKEARVVSRRTSQQAGLAALVELDPDRVGRRERASGSSRAGRDARRRGRPGRPRRRRGALRAAATPSASSARRSSPGAAPARRSARRSQRLAEGAEILTVIAATAPRSLGELEGHAPDGVEVELTTAASRTTGGCWPPSDVSDEPAGPLAVQLLQLQREGPLGARLQGLQPRAPVPACRADRGRLGVLAGRSDPAGDRSGRQTIVDSPRIIAALEDATA